MPAKDQFPGLPVSDALFNFMDDHPEFLASLKLSHPEKFICLNGMFVTSTPRASKMWRDKVIGVWYLDRMNASAGTPPLFKQDFIVDVGGASKEFISYSADNRDGKYVRSISEFFATYGSGRKYYHLQDGTTWEHHYADVDQLPAAIRPEGQRVLHAWRTHQP